MKIPNLKKYTYEDLEALDKAVTAEFAARNTTRAFLEKKNLNINGITNKDFQVTYADWNTPPDHPEFKPTFSFALKRGKKKYCIYYDFNREKPQKWWPTKKSDWDDGEVESAATDFIPDGFSECCENSYEYSGTTEEAIECLRRHGFDDIVDDQKRTGL